VPRLSLCAALCVFVAVAASSGGASSSAHLRATAIAAGLEHTCVVTSEGGVKCWGYNGHDELGNGRGDSVNSPLPTDVVGLHGPVVAVSSNGRHTCALTSGGGVACWGANYGGALGNGTQERAPAAVDVRGLGSGVTMVSAGLDHACALTSAGGVKCWGTNGLGQVGDGTTEDRFAPVDVAGLTSGAIGVAAGGLHSCALSSGGTVKCWGGGYGLSPVDVPGLTGIKALSPSCAVTTAGSVKCWPGPGRAAVDVPGLSDVTAIVSGPGHSCAITTGGAMKCWGRNSDGQLGDGSSNDRDAAVDVTGLGAGVVAIAAGAAHSCAVTSDGSVKCWGANHSGQLGDGTLVAHAHPAGVVRFSDAKAVVSVGSASVRVTKVRVAAIKLRCGAEAACRGTLKLTAVVKSGRRRVTLTLGSRGFTIPPAATATVEVQLSARGFNLLSRRKRLPARATATYSQPAGGSTKASRAVTLLAPKR
jgi:alpha-tubulin suppressor-like RCC1 family protein